MSSKALKRKRPVDAADEAPRKVENNEEKSQLAEIEAAIAICGDKSSAPESVFKAAIALQQTFSKLIRKGKFLPGGPKDGAKGAAEELSKWLREQYRTYQSHLLALLQHDEPRIQLTALDALMHLLKVESSKQQPADQYARFDNDAYLRIVRAALDNGNLNEHLQEQLLELAVAYHDLRYYTYADLATICPKLEAPSEQTLEAILSLLTMDPPLPKTAAEIDTFYALTTGKPPKTLAELPSFRKAYSQAWLAFLRLPMPVNVHKTVLLAIDSFAIPNLSDPNLLIDYLTSAVDAGGVQAVLGLSGLFTLIHKHNLDYPSFYPRLYALLTPELLRTKYRPRFLKQLDLFLSSTHLPAHLSAAFAKKLARLLLSAPAHACIGVLPMIYNIIRRHGLAKLVHRTEPLPADAKGRDPWDATELDPSQSNALDSSLWEIASLENHFHHAIAALAKLFRDRLDKPEYPLDEFMDQTAEGVLQVELGRKPKGGVALAIMEENKGGLFPAEQWEGWAF